MLFNGRPLALEDVVGDAPAILEAWFPGVQAGPAVADVVFGKVNPGGKLPVSFPYRVGQVPIYYNHEPTGRPCNKDVKWNSQHRDIPSCAPLFEFGYGLSYTTFEVSNLQLSSSTVSRNGSLKASVTVTNTGSRKGDEVVQLYIHDPVASISQPVRRLRGFERVTLNPGETRTVTFTLDRSDFGFYDNRGRFVVEPGQIDVYAGNSSSADADAVVHRGGVATREGGGMETQRLAHRFTSRPEEALAAGLRLAVRSHQPGGPGAWCCRAARRWYAARPTRRTPRSLVSTSTRRQSRSSRS